MFLQIHFEFGDVCDEISLFVPQMLELGDDLFLVLRNGGRCFVAGHCFLGVFGTDAFSQIEKELKKLILNEIDI